MHYLNNLYVEKLLSLTQSSSDLTIYVASNSILTLDFSTVKYYTIFTGNTVGQIVRLPDATTLPIGFNLYIYNSSHQIIFIEDFTGVGQTILGPNGRAHYIVRDVSTQAGVWDGRVSSEAAFSGTAPVLASYGANAGNNRYLEVVPGVASSSAPFPVPVNSTIIAVSLAADSNSTGTVGIFKTTDLNTPIYSVSLSANKINTQLNINIPLVQGDQIVWRITAGSISKPYIFTYISAT